MQRPNIIELREVRFAENELRDYIRALGLGDLFNQPLLKLLHQFEEAKNFGSLIQPCLTEGEIQSVRSALHNSSFILHNLEGQLFLRETHFKILRVLEQAEALTQRYHVVVANPPYMGGKNMNAQMKTFLQAQYDRYKADLFAAFAVRCIKLTAPSGRLGLMTPFVWMFLTSYESLRKVLLTECAITSLIQPEYHAFFDSAFVPICTFTVLNAKSKAKGVFVRLTDFYGESIQSTKALEAISDKDVGWRYDVNPGSFAAIPGMPIAYWLPERLCEAFSKFSLVGDEARAAKGLVTADNDKYVRGWSEVSFTGIGFACATRVEASNSGKRWFPYAKGGAFRRWNGNREAVVNWENDGFQIQNALTDDRSRVKATNFNLDRIFRPGISWTVVTSSKQSFRLVEHGFLFDAAAGVCQSTGEVSNDYILAALNCNVCEKILSALNPTLNLHPGYLESVPLPKSSVNEVCAISCSCSELSLRDWDNFETSWDFRDQPLLRSGQWAVGSGQQEQGASPPLSTIHYPLHSKRAGGIGRRRAPPPSAGCRSWRRRTTGSSSPPTASTASCSPKCPRSKSPSPAPTPAATWPPSSPMPSAA